MNKRLERIKFAGELFYCGAKAKLLNENTIAFSAGIGLIHGLKYRGSFKQGLKGGAASLLTLSAIQGVVNVIENYDKIKKI